MLIRKLFKFNGQHIVRNCSSQRCKKSIHAHTYTVEVLFKSSGLDNGFMVMDFGLMKGTVKDIIKSFDNSYSLWDKETEEFKDLIKQNHKRIVTMPTSPSAESYSLMFLFIIDKLIKATEFNNGEKNVEVHSVKVHETATGYAESFIEDLDWMDYSLKDIKFSEEVKKSWSNPKMFKELKKYSKGKTAKKPFKNPKEVLQIVS